MSVALRPRTGGLAARSIHEPVRVAEHGRAHDARNHFQEGDDQRPYVLVLVPAHNEEAVIGDTIASLRQQTAPADRIVVILDNCTDNTGAVAQAMGAETFTTAGNTNKKAGALNQAMEHFLPALRDSDGVLVMDADTTLGATFIEAALEHHSREIGGVGGVFLGRPAETLLGHMQRMEFFRYRRQILRHGERPFVLTGTGTLFRVEALRAVLRERLAGQILPHGLDYYDTQSLTEDNEMTLAIKTLGFNCVSPVSMSSYTDVMEESGSTPLLNLPAGLRKLGSQRMRWYLGALRNLRHYGRKLPPHMRWIYWRQQIGLMVTVLALAVYVLALTLTLAMMAAGSGSTDFAPLWLLATLLFAAERTVTVWGMGWRSRIIAATVIPEYLYMVFLQLCLAVSIVQFTTGKKGSWKAT